MKLQHTTTKIHVIHRCTAVLQIGSACMTPLVIGELTLRQLRRFSLKTAHPLNALLSRDTQQMPEI
jgi:hypothetical protein